MKWHLRKRTNVIEEREKAAAKEAEAAKKAGKDPKAAEKTEKEGG